MSEQNPSPEKANKPINPQESADKAEVAGVQKPMPREYKGYADQGLPEPTRYGDWDVKGRCSDF